MKIIIRLFLLTTLLHVFELKAQPFTDFALFKSGDQSLIEIYIGIPVSKAAYDPKNENASIVLLELLNQNNSLHSQLYLLSDTVANNQYHLDQLNLVYAPTLKDNLKIRYTLLNSNRERISEIKTDIFSVSSSSNIEILSDLQIASDIYRSDQSSSRYFKKNMELIPNPSLLFTNNDAKLVYYFETYIPGGMAIVQLIDNENEADTLKIIDLDKKNLHFGWISPSGLYSGQYKMKVQVKDQEGAFVAEATKELFISNTSKIKAQEVAKSEFEEYLKQYSGDDLDKMFAELGYISSDSEKKIYQTLISVIDKRTMINEMLRRKKPSQLSILQYYLTYKQFIEEANELFSTRYTEGWKTDRGRVYLIYGPPTDIERNYFEQEIKPHEIWTYDDLEGGVIFIFGDIADNKDYRLLHSTKRGEFSNPNWRSVIQVIAGQDPLR